MTATATWHPVVAGDGHRWESLVVRPDAVERVLVWIPALGVPARTYEPFARALALRGVATVVHEWRGFGSSSLRASRAVDWAYRELLAVDIPATRALATELFGATPQVIGGHSLGGQLATCSLALERQHVEALWLVASGSPYWRAFPAPLRYGLPAAYRLLRFLALAFGALPGRRIGFGGAEARSVIRDWSRTGLSGRYAAPGIGDLEPRLQAIRVPVRGVLFEHDWLAPRSSLDFLIDKLQPASVAVRELDDRMLGAQADHFAWMKSPAAVVDALVGD